MGSSREGVVADETAVETTGGALNLNGEDVVPEGESDDEYEQVPKKQEKQRKLDHTTTSRQAATQQPMGGRASGHQDEKAMGVSNEVSAEVTTDSTKPDMEVLAPSVAKDATDDDWLRSRTNRLLDLVDPDDLLSQTLEAKQEAGEDDGAQGAMAPPPRPLGEASGEVVVPEQTFTTSDDKLATATAISRTSRLFVRNLAYSVKEDDLRSCFEQFGTLEEVSCKNPPSFSLLFTLCSLYQCFTLYLFCL